MDRPGQVDGTHLLSSIIQSRMKQGTYLSVTFITLHMDTPTLTVYGVSHA